MALEKVRRNKGGHFVFYDGCGILRLSENMREAMGNPDMISLFVDREEKHLGLKVHGDDTFNVRSNGQVYCKLPLPEKRYHFEKMVENDIYLCV